MHQILIILLVSLGGYAFDMCSPITLGDYSFDISTLSSQTIGLPGGAGHIDYFNCNPSSCSNSNIPSNTTEMYNQQAHILKIQNSQCFPMSIGGTII